MQLFLLIVELIIALTLAVVILIQPSDDQGFGAVSNHNFFGGKAMASALTKFTSLLGFLFFAICIALSIAANMEKSVSSINRKLSEPSQSQSQSQNMPLLGNNSKLASTSNSSLEGKDKNNKNHQIIANVKKENIKQTYQHAGTDANTGIKKNNPIKEKK